MGRRGCCQKDTFPFDHRCRPARVAPHRPARAVLLRSVPTCPPVIRRLPTTFALALLAFTAEGISSQQGTPPSPAPSASDSTAMLAARASSGPFFFKNRGFGTDEYAGPFDVVLNKGFPTAAWSDRSRDIFDYPYGWGGVWASVSRPLDAIERYGGWSPFLRQQVFPLTAGLQNFKWYANYFGHLMEGGIVYRRVSEWYEAAGVPWPSVAGAVTTYAAAVINEAYEAPLDTQPKGATTADLLIFDPLAILLFSSDGVARFFAHDLRAAVWPQQGSLRINDGWVINNAEHLVFKLPIPGMDRTRLFYKTGLGIQFGLTRRLSNGIEVTAAFGRDALRQNIDPVNGRETVDLQLSAGVFVDIDNNLLWSIYWSETADRRLAVNVYPGVVDLWGLKVGMWGVLERDGAVNFGWSVRQTMGLGLGARF